VLCLCVSRYILKLEKFPTASRGRQASTGVATDKDSPLMTAAGGEGGEIRLLRPADQLCPYNTAIKVPIATSQINNHSIKWRPINSRLSFEYMKCTVFE